MVRGSRWARACLLGLGLFVMLAPALAQTVTPEDEYKDLIRVSQDIQPLGEHPFGAQIGLYDGSLSFEQTDVSLSGNGPLLQLGRSFKIEGKDGFGGRLDKAFGDWDIALPHIETMVAEGWFYSSANGWQQLDGWQVNAAGDTHFRCANFNKPLAVTTMPNVSGLLPWEPVTWWHGYHLIVPGHGSQDLLSNAGPDDATYPAVTKNHWRIRCINETTTANGKPGDGFIAQAPDGTRYWFNELAYRWAPTLERPLYSTLSEIRSPGRHTPASLFNRKLLARLIGTLTGSAPAHAMPDHDFLQRRKAWMLVTKIEDRFGNWLKYSYDADGYLTAIKAGVAGNSTVRRELTVQYVSDTHRIHSVTLQPSNAAPREWTYTYDTQIAGRPRLTAVTLPDGRQWQFDLVAFDSNAALETDGIHSCNTLGDPVDATWSGSITHPSGLTGQFVVYPAKHGRSDVPRECRSMQTSNGYDDPGSYAVIPKAWYSYTIKSKTFSGAGIPAGQTWHYSYSPANASWSADCTSGCTSTVWTQVLHPDGSSIKSTFSNRYDYSESQLKRTDYYSGDGTGLLRTVINYYAAPTGQPWPDTVGHNLQTRINSEQTERRSPLIQRDTHQAGDTYTWKAEAFNVWAQVTKTKRFNSIAGQPAIEESTTYCNDTTHWVLGLPQKQVNLTTGETINQYTYDCGTTDLLTSRSHFGQSVMTYTWNGAGQLAGFTDANTHTTTLGSYKRGIPQSIGYPDGTSQSLVVDDFGQITAITNQAGDVTHYSYDAAGRLHTINYPGSYWQGKTFTYSFVTGAERGLGANHWKRTVSQGDARHVTWYDALLRPVLTDTSIAGVSTSHISASKTYNWKGLTTFAAWPVAGSPSLSGITAGTKTIYDALGRAVAVSQPSELGTLTTTTTYLSGARKRTTDPAGHITTTTYQVFDQPGYKAVTQVQAPEGIVQTIARNLYGDPTAITQSGPDGQGGTVSLVKRLYYNAQHRLCRTQEPETGSTLMGYDAAGNLLWSAQGQTVSGSGCGSTPASRTKRTYDAMNRLETVSYPDGHGNTVTTYDAMGQILTTVAGTTSGPIQWTYAYDALGHLTGETLDMDGYPFPIGYAYDANGALSQVTYPDGKSVAYAPDALGRPTKAGTYASSVLYYPDGALKDFLFGNGTEYYADRNNARHLVANLTYATGSTIVISRDYGYDKNANITSVDDLVGTNDKTLSYDALNRLTLAKATGSWGTEAYAYDALNNVRKLTGDGLIRTYQYDTANRLTAIGSGGTTLHTFAYDPTGNITQKDSQSRVFSTAHRLLSVPGTASYIYDAAGRRVKKTDSGGHPTYYAYGRAGQLMYRWDKATDVKTDYVYLGKKLVAGVETALLPPASAPSLSVPATNSDGSYTISWGTVGTATSYTLQEQTNGGSWSTLYNGNHNSKGVSGKSNGSYGYRVRACNAGGCGSWSTTHSVTVLHPPAAPASLSVPTTDNNGSYTVSWGSVGTATSYTLQERTNSGSWSTVYSGSSRSKAVSGKANGSYGYRVNACNAGGCGSWSTTHSVTVLHPPAAPSSLSVPATDNDGNYTVSWGSASTATGYTLQELADGGSWSTVYNNGTSLSKAIGGKANGSYGYRVRACNAGGCSGWSATKSVLVTHSPGAAPSLSVPSTDNDGSYTVSWGSVGTATSYTLQEQVNGGSWTTAYSGSNRSKAISGKGNGSYGYRVRACNVGGCGNWSTSQTVTVTHPPASAPSLSVPSTDNNGSYTVSWGSVATATSYTLQEQVNAGSWATTYSGSNRSEAISGKGNGSYGYRVRACNAGGCGSWSGTKTVNVLHPPVAPGSISVPATSSGSVAVSWAASSTASSYTLRQSIDGASYTTVYTGASRSRTLTVNTTGSYRYAVRACNSGGCSGYRYSSYVAVTMPPASAPSLSAPSADNNGSYTVSWGSVSATTSYTLQQRTGSGSWSTVYSGSNRSKAFSGKSNGSYGYRVRACNGGGCSAWSGTRTVVVTYPPASAPTNLSAPTSDSNGYYTVSWHSVSTATRYTLQERKDSGSWSTIYDAGSLSKSRSALSDGTYGYRVRACNVGGCSSWSATRNVVVIHPPTSAPSLSVPSSSHDGSYTVSWGSVSRATSYTLQERKNSGSWSTIYSGASRSKARSGRTDGSYGYRVRGCNASGCGAWSATHTVSVIIIPAAPTGVAIDAYGGTYKFIPQYLVWNAVSTATHYDVKVGSSSTIINVGTATSYQVGGYFLPPPMPLPTATGYVRACNANGCSAWVKGSGT